MYLKRINTPNDYANNKMDSNFPLSSFYTVLESFNLRNV